MRTALYIVLGIVLLALAAGIGFLSGNKQALNALSFESVTPDQMVQAMGDDNFFRLWREKTLIVSGTVADVSTQSGDTRIELTTNSVSKAYCDIGTATTSLKTGDAIRALAEGERAERIPEGVLLLGCTVL